MKIIEKVKRCLNCSSESFAFKKVRYIAEPGGLQDFYEWQCHECGTKVTIPVDKLVNIVGGIVT